MWATMSLPLPASPTERPLAHDPSPRALDAERCANCGAPVAATYCGACGERRRTADALSLRRLAADGFEHATSLDVRLLRTLVALVRRPGEPTRAWVAGARGRYTPPVQLFLLLTVVFWLAAPRLGLLRYSIGREGAAAIVSWAHRPPPRRPLPLVDRAMLDAARRTGATAEQFHARINASIETRTRSMLPAFIAALAALLAAAYAWRRRYLAEHVVFATHYVTFLLLWVPAVIFPVEALLDALEARGTAVGTGWASTAIAVPVLGGLYAYLALALRRAYGDRWPAALLRAALVLGAFAIGASRLFYRTVLLVSALFV